MQKSFCDRNRSFNVFFFFGGGGGGSVYFSAPVEKQQRQELNFNRPLSATHELIPNIRNHDQTAQNVQSDDGSVLSEMEITFLELPVQHRNLAY